MYSLAKKYPRLTRSGLVLASALAADQVSQAYGAENEINDFFGLLSFIKPVQASVNSNTVTENGDGAADSNEFVDYINLRDNEKDVQVRVLQDEEIDFSELSAEEIRAQTVYPEPFLSEEATRHGGFIIYVAGKINSIFFLFSVVNFISLNQLLSLYRNYVCVLGHLSSYVGLYQSID